MSLHSPTKDTMLGVVNNGRFSRQELPSFNCAYGLSTRHSREGWCDSWINNKKRIEFLYHISHSIAFSSCSKSLGI